MDIDTDRNIYLHIDVPTRSMYHRFRNATFNRNVTMENSNYPKLRTLHWFLLAAIKNTDFYLFEEIIEDIDDVWERSSACYINLINVDNPILGDTYFNIVSRNGLTQFATLLWRKGAFSNFNGILHNIFLPLEEDEHINKLAVFLQQKISTIHLEVNLDISLHIAVRRNDLICAYMLLRKGARADISYAKGITALHLAALKGNVDMIKLIFSESQQPLDMNSYKDYNNLTTQEVIENLSLELQHQSNVFENLQIPLINEQTLKFFLSYSDETKCLKVMREGFYGELSLDIAEELLYIATRRNFCRIVRDILKKLNKNPKNLNVLKNIAVICGNHAILHDLLKLEPEITNDLIMNAYRLLKVSVQEMSNEKRNEKNTSDRLKCLKLILESENMDVCCTDDTHNDWTKSHIELMIHRCKEDSKTDEVMIHKKLEVIDTENVEFYKQFNYTEITVEDKSVENHSTNLNYFCNLCCILCRLFCPTMGYSTPYFLKYTKIDISMYTDDQKIYMLDKILKIIRLEPCYNNRSKYRDILASLLEQITINPNLERALNNASNIAMEMNDLMCAYMLLCKSANANDPNIRVNNMKALQLAERNYNVDMVKLMESQQDGELTPDFDTTKNYWNALKRGIIKNVPKQPFWKFRYSPLLDFYSNFEDLQIPPIKEQTLKFFLNNSDENKCLKVMKEGFYGELSLSVAEELLNIAMQRNYYKIIQEILGKLNESPINLNEVKDTAVLWGDHAMLRKLLELQPEVTNDLILNACQQLKIPPGKVNNTFDRLECLKLILEQKNVDVCCTDDQGNTPMHYALEANCYEAASLLLKQDNYLGHVNKSNNSIDIANIPAFVLSSYFNDCIQLKEEWTDECTIKFDHRCLMPHNNFEEQHETYQATREMEVISRIANNDSLKHLLKHPLLSSYLYIKWYRIRYVLYANFVFYMMFYFFVNTYVLCTYDTSPSKNGNNTVFANILQNTCRHDIFLWIFIWMLLLFIFREILQFVFCPRQYLIENWSQVLIILALALLRGIGIQISILIILLVSAWKLMTSISHHLFLSTSTSTEMFRVVCFNFVRIFFPYLFLINAFALAFYMLLRNDKFSNPYLSLFKTIIMLTGEFGFEEEDTTFTAYPILSRIVFALFVFNIVIVLVNLLNGLAISNIAEILNKTEIIGLISRVRLIVYLERMVVGKPFCWNSQWNPFNFLSSRILLFPYFRNGEMCLKPYDNLIVYDSDTYVDNKSKNKCCDKCCFTLKMDPNIIKRAKQIAYKTDVKPSNDDLMYEINKLQKQLSRTSDNFKRLQ